MLDFNIGNISLIVERITDSEWSLSNHSNIGKYTMAYVIKGKALYSFDTITAADITQGHVLFFKNGITHSGHSNREHPWHFYSAVFEIIFNDESTKGIIDNLPTIIKVQNETIFAAIMKQLYTSWIGKRSYSIIECRSLLIQLLMILLKQYESRDINPTYYRAVENVITLLQTDISHKYTCQELADFCHISYSYFRMLFKKITGVSPLHYQNLVRINKAKDLLLSGDCNVTEASELVGIDDIYYFSRLFKKINGQPPSSFINKK